VTRRSNTRIYGIEAAADREPYAYERFTAATIDDARAWVASAPIGFRRRLYEVRGDLRIAYRRPRQVVADIVTNARPLTPWQPHHYGRRGASFGMAVAR
jgi:hypothetical protein